MVLVGGATRAVGRVGTTGWVYGVGTGRGYTGVLPTHRAGRPQDSEAGPVGPSGAGVGGPEGGCVYRRLDGPRTHPPGPVGAPGPSLSWVLGMPPPGQ